MPDAQVLDWHGFRSLPVSQPGTPARVQWISTRRPFDVPPEVLMNHLEPGSKCRHGDLFAPVATERFDLILFNPPFVRGTPRTTVTAPGARPT